MMFNRASFAERVPEWSTFGPQVELYSDVDASVEGTQDRQQRQHLVEAIRQLPAVAKALGYPEISGTTLRLAATFVQQLPQDRALPRVAVDDEGDILMDWNVPTQRCALTFEGRKLHMVVNPGSHSRHVDPTIYTGGYIPPVLLAEIPKRS